MMRIQQYETSIKVDSFFLGVKYTNPLPAKNSMPIKRKVTSVNTVKPMPPFRRAEHLGTHHHGDEAHQQVQYPRHSRAKYLF
jgi:hypothetical protein